MIADNDLNLLLTLPRPIDKIKSCSRYLGKKSLAGCPSGSVSWQFLRIVAPMIMGSYKKSRDYVIIRRVAACDDIASLPDANSLALL